MRAILTIAVLLGAASLRGQTVAEGVAALDAARFDEAARILAAVVQREPDSADANFYLGLAHFRAGRAGAARPFLERAAALSSADPQVWKTLGLVTTSAGDSESAIAALRKACELAPRDDEACYFLARNLFAAGHYKAAQAPFETALRAAPPAMATKVHRAIALNFAAMGADVEAEKHFRQAIQQAVRPIVPAEDARVDYGAFLFRQGRTAAAIAPLQEAAREQPSSARAHVELGRVLLHLEKVEAAVASLETAVRLDPADPNAHLLLGRAYLRLGRQTDGEREMRLGQERWAGKR